MSLRRRLATAVGLLSVLVGFAGVLGVLTPLSLTDLFVTLVGAVTVMQGARYALDRRTVDVRSASLGDPERRYRAPVPGESFDAELDVRRPSPARRKRVRERVREAAVDSLVAQGLTRAEARTAVEGGAWTDDPGVAAFLDAGPTPLPVADRVRAFVRGETTFQIQTRRAVAAVESLWEGEGPPAEALSADAPGADGASGGDDSGWTPTLGSFDPPESATEREPRGPSETGEGSS